jgi:hypothetical protein
MSVTAGRSSVGVTSAYVNAVHTTGATVLSSGNDDSGLYSITVRVDNGGCGGPDFGVFVQLKDTIAWNGISFRVQLSGTAACWSFNNNPGYGAISSYSTTGYLQSYDTNLGDQISLSYLAQQDPQYSSHDPVYACDNDANNFMRFNADTFKFFTMKRRRDTSGNLAGPYIGRSCTSTGAGSLVIINNIFIWGNN